MYIIDVDGQNEALLAEDACYADWSPDGKRIVLEARRPKGVGMYIIDLEDEDWELLMLGAGEPEWSPDGKKIVFRSPGSQICVMDVKGKDFVQLTNVPWPGSAVSPCWSPDGKKIAYWVAPGTWIMDAKWQKPASACS